MFRTLKLAQFLPVLAVLAVCMPVSAEVIVSQSGNQSPLTQGWTRLSNTPAGGSEGGVNDGGVLAWQVSDTSNTQSSFSYQQQLTNDQINTVNTRGWRLSSTFRILDAEDTPGGSISLAFRTDTTAYDVLIGATGGDPRLILPTDTGQEDLTLTSLGGGYHTYDLTYNPNTDSADLAVNGTTVLSNWGGRDFSTGSFGFQRSVVFGSNAGTDTGTVNFASLTLTAIPEPSHFAFVGVLIAAGLTRFRRRNGVC